ncbi:MAG: galactosamine-6-phosphate isomerase [Verrucomicrobiales bacterium]|jgi:galactosamine-6-phosphate isomerase
MLADWAVFLNTRHKEPVAQTKSHFMNIHSLPATWKWHVTRDYEAGSAVAAKRLLSAWRANSGLLICAATGNSPTGTYNLFAQSILSEGVQPTDLRILKLDEWGGLPPNDPATCEVYLQEYLVRPLEISQERFFGFQCDAPSPDEECQRVSAWLDQNGPIDMCVLGLGVNGHLGFNEPGDVLTADCHVAKLTPESLSHGMLSATSRQPSHGLTVGMRGILASRTILLLVFGEAKAEQLNRLAKGGLATNFPASFLTLHQQVVCVCDEAAAARLPDISPSTPY